MGGVGQTYFFLALTLAHRFLAAALMLASPCGEIRLPLIGAFFFRLAHLALCAAAIRLRAAADMRPVRVLEEVLPRDVRALMAVSRRSRSCWSSLTIASRFAMRGIVAAYDFP
jgi:hypothetical protein